MNQEVRRLKLFVHWKIQEQKEQRKRLFTLQQVSEKLIWQPQISEKELAEFFPEADLILLEGFKYSTYPKIEIIRKGNSAESVCNPEKLMAIATNLDAEERDALSVLENVPFFELDNAECIAEFILSDYFR